MIRRAKIILTRREQRVLVRMALVCCLISLLMLAFFPRCSLYSRYQVVKETEVLLEKNSRLEKENRELAREIDLLKHDEKYLEAIAREKYGMLKNNEEVYYVRPPEGRE